MKKIFENQAFTISLVTRTFILRPSFLFLKLFLVLSGVFAISHQVNGEQSSLESQGIESHSLESHTHGLGEMTLVFDSTELLVEILSPAANFLGFEHHPKNDEEKTHLNNVIERLNKPETIITLSPQCLLEDINVDSSFINNASKTVHSDAIYLDEQTHDSHEAHDAHKNHDSHDEHEDINIAYRWRCEKSSPLAIQIHIFDHFSGFETLRIQWIVNGQQGAKRLTKSDSEIRF